MSSQSLIIPRMLKEGDTIAVVSPSWGGPFNEPEVYARGCQVLRNVFNVSVIDMPNTKRSPEFLRKNPQARADDIAKAFADTNVNGIIASIGGLDSIRLFDHMAWDIMTQNPKIFMGFSDTTCIHFMCRHAGISSFYGPSVLANFGTEPVSSYTLAEAHSTLFTWHAQRTVPLCQEGPYRRQVLQGQSSVTGHLIGGCIETFDMMYDMVIWPTASEFKGAILFIETVPSFTSVESFKIRLRALGKQGVFEKLNGILFGRAGDIKGGNTQASDYNEALRDIVSNEFGQPNLTIFVNVEFGHTQSITILPYGTNITLDPANTSISFEGPVVAP